MTVTADRSVDAAQAALTRATARLLSLQHPDGYWKGELETNVTIDAEDVFLRHYLGIATPETTGRTARWIRSRQRPDGSWATYHGGPGDLSTTVEAYVALRVAGDPPGAAHMARAAAFVREAGGVGAARVFTRMWLALLGLWSWETVPTLPPEQILLPPRVPLSVYTFGCWARQTIVALSVVTTTRPSAAVPFAIDELRGSGPPPGAPNDLWGRLFLALDRLAHFYGRHPFRPLRRFALRAAERWIVDRQERDGSWGGIQPPWVWSIVALRTRGYELDHPVIVRALAGLDTFTIDDGLGRRLEACQSPVWDTALSVLALLDAGVSPSDPAIVRAADWLAAQEVRTRGDWAVRCPKLAPGGFPFEFANDNYPDVDDTAVVVLALRRAGRDAGGSADRGIDWMLGMQSRSGGWGAFDVDNTSRLSGKIAFCDFGAVTDPPSSDVTAHVLETLAHEERTGERPAQRGLDWLLRQQEPDGSWFGRWGANYVYGTGAVLPALAACGLNDHPSVRRAVRWLETVQNPGGGYGEDLRSYRDRSWSGRGVSTASQTAWALIGLHAAGEGEGEAAAAAVRWLVETQRPDGGWDEPFFTGTGFPRDFYLNYHLYRDVFPVMALGRVLGAADA
jgi:squalene-hopene/tetraprenyl-beta-curcumene cyclase